MHADPDPDFPFALSRLGAVLFAISVVGLVLNRKNLIVLLMAIELMLLAVNLNFIAFSYYLGDTAGQIFVFFILTVAAAESAIGLAILVVLFRNIGGIAVDDLGELKGNAMRMQYLVSRRPAGALARRDRCRLLGHQALR
jgi:NADH-quinone oxidoreductase subunit K